MDKYPSHILVTTRIRLSDNFDYAQLNNVARSVADNGESQRGSYDQPYRQRLQRYFQPFYHFWGILHPAFAMLTFNHAAHEPCLA